MKLLAGHKHVQHTTKTYANFLWFKEHVSQRADSATSHAHVSGEQ